MRLLVGWYNPSTGQLVDIPGFDAVESTVGWLPAIVEVAHRALTAGPMLWTCTCGQTFPSAEAYEAHKEHRDG